MKMLEVSYLLFYRRVSRFETFQTILEVAHFCFCLVRINNAVAHIYHRNLSSAVPTSFVKEKFLTGAGWSMVSFSSLPLMTKHDGKHCP